MGAMLPVAKIFGLSAILSVAIVTAYDLPPQARETSPVSQKFTDRVLPSQSEPTMQIAVYAPVGARATAQGDAKADSLRVKLDDRCAAQTWPNISSDCVVNANGSAIRKTVRTITIEERTGPNSSALARHSALEVAMR